ncbi:peptidylprolyl isomerase [Actinocorallia longicatena]|uniref:Peptidyl-prolyl cis-trans isomerase n=1 Tax=Actinocorallia longicatena TaxID=111803 RepID=A0ABP6Q9E9_9ACTN
MAETIATLNTTVGKIVVRLFPDLAPNTVANFVGLAEGSKEWKHPGTGQVSNTPLYNGTIFHRVIDNFMIQGGDPLGKGIGGPGYDFDDEIHAQNQFNRKYLLAMANAGKRGGRGTNGSQFFITTTETPWLNGGHTIFGEVIEGTDVVDAINNVATGPGDRPLQDVAIETVTIERR